MGLVRTDLELELEAREASVAGNMVGAVGGGHGERQTALRVFALATVLLRVETQSSTTSGRLLTEALGGACQGL